MSKGWETRKRNAERRQAFTDDLREAIATVAKKYGATVVIGYEETGVLVDLPASGSDKAHSFNITGGLLIFGEEE